MPNKMKRIKLRDVTFDDAPIANGINRIMDYLELHLPIKKEKNGLIWSCTNCGHATAYLADLGKCCEKPLYEVSG